MGSNAICKCNYGLNNTALPGCVPIAQVIKKVIFVQLQNNAGTLAYINPSTTLNKAWATALINNTDKSTRWFPTPELKNVTLEKEAPVFESYEDGSSYFVREGVRKIAAVIPDCPPMYKAALESVRCNANTGVFFVDINGNIIGLTNESDGNLYPFPINTQSMVGSVVFGDDKQVGKVNVMFELPAYIKDADIRMIQGTAFPDFSPVTLQGLLTVNATLVGAVTDTGMTVQLTTPSPDLSTNIAVTGWLLANFVSSSTGSTGKIYDVTDSTDKTITSVTESATIPGQYTFVWTSMSGKTLTLAASTPGYDSINLQSLAVVTP